MSEGDRNRDRKAYDELLLDVVYGIRDKMEKLETDVFSISTRLTVIETKAIIYATVTGFVVSVITTIFLAYLNPK